MPQWSRVNGPVISAPVAGPCADLYIPFIAPLHDGRRRPDDVPGVTLMINPERARLFSRRRSDYVDEPGADEIDEALADLDLVEPTEAHEQTWWRKQRSRRFSDFG